MTAAIWTMVILGSITIVLLIVGVRESGAALADLEDYEEDEPV